MYARPHQRVTTIMMALALFAGAAACGGDDDDAASSTDDAASAGAATATTAGSTTAAPDTTVAETTAPPSTTSPATTVPPSSTVPAISQSPECDPFGTLVTRTLNDRCRPSETDDPQQPPGVDELGTAFYSASLWNGADPNDPNAPDACPGLIAVPGQIIVTVAPDVALDDAANQVAGILGGTPGDPIAEDAQIVNIDPNTSIDAVLSVLPSLQAEGRSADLNYLEPVLPNNVFRPADDPELAEQAQIDAFLSADFRVDDKLAADGKSVVVIDSTGDLAMYDIGVNGQPGNGFIDEDQGHGAFVASIIERTGASVDLIPVQPVDGSNNPSLLASGRWAPMMIQDADIITALDSVSPSTNVVNMSLGGVGCRAGARGYPWGIGERLALARKMNNLRLASLEVQELPGIVFVAAAGNNGNDVLHFPAAWRNDEVTDGLANELEQSVASEVQQLHDDLTPAIFAVGSVDEDNDPSYFTNCGAWVNAAAFGNKQVGVYPAAQPGGFSPDVVDGARDFAVWSGTSFATANFTAALVSGRVDTTLPDPSVVDDLTGARMMTSEGLEPCPPP